MPDDSLRDVPGYVYLNALYVERLEDGNCRLLIGRTEWHTGGLYGCQPMTLADLEEKLYEFACDEGYCDD